MQRKNRITSKTLILVFLVAAIRLQGMAQDTRSAQTLGIIVNDGHNSPESRVLTCQRNMYKRSNTRATEVEGSHAVYMSKPKEVANVIAFAAENAG